MITARLCPRARTTPDAGGAEDDGKRSFKMWIAAPGAADHNTLLQITAKMSRATRIVFELWMHVTRGSAGLSSSCLEPKWL
eukprot:CAMPEP_0117497306 /NCGR_PEP_ID=MMETSP0784-20121206/21114_1 /TAXON_ID=39447 /ORGANISM="" /LENGTH=80 /DNA_ID=CAMNT_0005292323 /DNA_START=569 /DNA_END=808 /DNA_ORIENTATION=-